MNGSSAGGRVIRTGVGVPVRHEGLRIPLWVTVLWLPIRATGHAGLWGLRNPLKAFGALLGGLFIWLGVGGGFGRAGAICLLALTASSALGLAGWRVYQPTSYEHIVGAPLRRHRLRRWAIRSWPDLARQCGLSRQHPATKRVRRNDGWDVVETTSWIPPRLLVARSVGQVLELHIRAAGGHTLTEIEAGAERLAVAAGAVTYKTRRTGPSTVCVSLVMGNTLDQAVQATAPTPPVLAVTDEVVMGRTVEATPWVLRMAERHTLIVGCSGSGKGSVLWGICGGLAPAVHVDKARLWGIDLKRGIEIGMGSGLFTATAYTPADALDVLKELLSVIDQRGEAMRGTSRLHVPTVGDPLHVLVIDELAALTAYADRAIRDEASRLLSEVLTQGRAVGVLVVACVQDPRKDIVAMRGLFTQTIALRLKSASETVMVLGEGTAQTAPAHHINPDQQGTAWLIAEDGTANLVRADFWPDPLVRTIAKRYATPVRTNLAGDPGGSRVGDGGGYVVNITPGQSEGEGSLRRKRAPRAPRAPRATAEDGAA